VLGPNGAGKTTFVRAVATCCGSTRLAASRARRVATWERCGARSRSPGSSLRSSGDDRPENLQMVARLFGLDRVSARARAERAIAQLGLSEA
jgi:ABC-type multidrug transport system ATPase subunit